MAKVRDPVLFSQYFEIESDLLAQAGLINPLLDIDTPLFIDPVLLAASNTPRIKETATQRFRDHFNNIVRLLAISEREGDAAWRGAQRQLDLNEPPENGLGYGGSGRSGSSRPKPVRDQILRTTKDIIRLGVRDPEMISLMGFFEEDVGPDTISDFTTRTILEDLGAITEEFCRRHAIPVAPFRLCPTAQLPSFRDARQRAVPILLVPVDIVRELPVANDWSEIQDAAMQNAQIRDRVNEYLAGITKPTVAERKSALRDAALSSPANFREFLESVKENTTNYDPNLDLLGYFKARSIIEHGLDGLRQERRYDLASGPEAIQELVQATLDQFRHHVEHGNLWEELWADDRPKKERASQIIYHAIADAFCRANDIDISPEANMGGGPIDFKFSKGYAARVLVEMKRSGGSVVHGYEKQLEFYKDASRTEFAIFVVMDYGDLGTKLVRIQEIRLQRLAAGERASEIVVINARKKPSASKRD